jgi:methylmalonyl-CoA mutase
MTTQQPGLRLAAEFDEVYRAQWRQAVRGVLDKTGTPVTDEAAPEMTLAGTTYDGITRRPLYTREDAPADTGFPGLAPFTRGGRAEGAAQTGWDVRARHAESDAESVNAAALADLEGGATSLWLVLGRNALPVADLDRALAGVDLDLAPVVLDAGADYPEAARELLRLHGERGTPASQVRGNLGADPLGLRAATGDRRDLAEAARLAARCAGEYPELRAITVDALPYHRAGGSDAEELGASMASGVAYLRALTEQGMAAADAVAALEFRYAATADQFLTIAKFRAARRMWARVTEACGAPAAQRQHAVTSPAMLTTRDPWVNMLRTTLACFGAGAGGAGVVTVAPFDAAFGTSDDFSRRIARNTSAILIEETKLAGVVDPGGGSWYVERLTDDLAHAAWDVFTEIERAGGIAAALDSGMVADRLAATWQRRRENIAHRRDPLTGVSEFPDPHERLPKQPAAPARRTGGLPVVRYAQDFEHLRDRVDAHAARTGARPAVFLATLGPVASHSARAAFATHLFGAAGIDVLDPGETDDVAGAYAASGASMCCVCGSERSYGEQAASVSAALQRAGARLVYLAGAPREELPGVDGFVHTGCDAVAALTETLAALGIDDETEVSS